MVSCVRSNTITADMSASYDIGNRTVSCVRSNTVQEEADSRNNAESQAIDNASAALFMDDNVPSCSDEADEPTLPRLAKGIEVSSTNTVIANDDLVHSNAANHRKRAPESSVLDRVIETWNDEIDNCFEPLNSMQVGKRTFDHHIESVSGSSRAHVCAPDHLGNRGDYDDAESGSSRAGPSTAARRLDDLREHMLGRVVGKMQRLAND